MKASYSEIKENAKSSMSGHIGEAILVGLVLPIAFSMIAGFFNGFFSFIHWSLPTFLSMFTGAITTYITIRMVIKIVRHKPDDIFVKFLGTKKGILNSIGFAVLSSLLVLVYVIIFWEYFMIMWDLIKIMPADYFASDPAALESWIDDQVFNEPSTFALIASLIYSVFLIFVSVRISFTTYIIADLDLNLLDAMKKSWKITKGNWWRIVFFPLSFILWLFAVIFTFGLAIIYVGPYMTIAQGSFYDNLLFENGEHPDSGEKAPSIKKSLTDENALDVDKTTFDKEDPFENYYE